MIDDSIKWRLKSELKSDLQQIKKKEMKNVYYSKLFFWELIYVCSIIYALDMCENQLSSVLKRKKVHNKRFSFYAKCKTVAIPMFRFEKQL